MNTFLVSAIVSVVFIILKIIEFRFTEMKPIKYLIRDALVVYFSVIIGNFVIDQTFPLAGKLIPSSDKFVFTGNPDF